MSIDHQPNNADSWSTEEVNTYTSNLLLAGGSSLGIQDEVLKMHAGSVCEGVHGEVLLFVVTRKLSEGVEGER